MPDMVIDVCWPMSRHAVGVSCNIARPAHPARMNRPISGSAPTASSFSGRILPGWLFSAKFSPSSGRNLRHRLPHRLPVTNRSARPVSCALKFSVDSRPARRNPRPPLCRKAEKKPPPWPFFDRPETEVTAAEQSTHRPISTLRNQFADFGRVAGHLDAAESITSSFSGPCPARPR